MNDAVPPAPVAPAPVAPAAVLCARTVETRGLWLPAAGDPAVGAADRVRVWVPVEVLTELDDARAEGRWVQTDTLSQEDALVAAGFAVRDGDAAFVRGTDALAGLLRPVLDEHGGQVYDPAVHGPFYPGDPGTEEMVAAAEADGFLRCFGCGVLPVTFSRLRYHDNRLSVEYDNALLLTVAGGYAMFFDDTAQQLVACHDCAHALCDRFPALAAVLRPVSAHAHSDRYRRAHPEHVGWDTGADGEFDEAHIVRLRGMYPDPDPRVARPGRPVRHR